MKTLKHYTEFLDNQAIIEEELCGYGCELQQRHQTTISDPEVQEQIKKLSFLEVIS